MATINANNFSSPLGVSNGGTGSSSFTAYAPLCGGTSSTSSLQQSTSGLSTSNNVITSNGASALPTWIPQNAGLVLLNTQTASNSASLSFTSTYITSTYTTYLIIFNNISSQAVSGGNLLMTWSTNNGSTYLSTNYQTGLLEFVWNATTVLSNTNSTTAATLCTSLSVTTYRTNGYLFINLPQSGKSSYVGRSFDTRTATNAIANSLFGNNSDMRSKVA